MEKKRVYYLDMARGIGVILMVLGHVPDLSVPTRRFVTSFHMPLFFVLSGMVICLTGECDREMRTIRRRKARSIMLPYAVFSALSLIVEALCTGFLKNGTWEVFREHLFGTLCLAGESVFWFLPALFFGELLFIALRRKTTGALCGVLTAVLAVLAYLAHVWENRLFAVYGTAVWGQYLHLFLNAFIRVFFAAAFVAIGYAGYRLIGKLSEKKLVNMLVGSALLALTVWVSSINGITDMNYMVYENIFLYLITSVAGSFGVILLCRAAEGMQQTIPARICRYYGRNSLIVMMTHATLYIMYIAARFTYGVNNHIFPLNQILLCGGMTCMVLLIEIPVIEVLNRYFPFLLGKKRK